jgi:hypothetical protein
LTSLVKKIDEHIQAAVGKTARPQGAYVLFMNNDGLDQRLRDMAGEQGLQRVALGIGAPPPDYQVANEADVTVVVYNPARRGGKVTANFALRKGELDDAKADEIAKAVRAVLPPDIHTVVAHSREKEQQWRYTFDKPADHWFKPDFNDLSWKIWLRREIILPDCPFTHLQFQLHHDDHAEVYLNGVLAAKLTGYTTGYKDVPISEEARKTLRPGANVLAVTCTDTGGGQYIDVGLIEVKR